MMKTNCSKWILISALALLLPATVMGQDTPSDSSSKPPVPEQGVAANPPHTSERGAEPAASSALGSIFGPSSVFPDNRGMLHWGPLYLNSFSAESVYNTVDTVATKDNILAGIFRWDINFIHQFRRTRMSLQYKPQVAIVDGEFQNDLANQDIGFATEFAISPKTTLAVGDNFTYTGRQSALTDFLSFDSVTSQTSQNRMLDGNLDYLSNSVRIAVEHQFSAATRVRVSPSYTYSRSSGSAFLNQSGSTISGFSDQLIGINTRVSHNFGPNKSLSGYHTLQYIKTDYGSTQTVNQPTGYTPYNLFGMGYSQLLTPNVMLTLEGGATAAKLSSQLEWNATGMVSLVRRLKNASFGITLSRDQSFAGDVGYVAANSFGNRADLNYSRTWGQRLTTEISGGYYTGNDGTGLKIGSKYGTARVTYRLTRYMNFDSGYTYKYQNGDNVQIYTGSRSIIMAGLLFNFAREQGTVQVRLR